MPLLDQVTALRLTKVLALTGSSFDGEAVAAIRRANEILKARSLTWSDLIAATIEAPSSKAGHARHGTGGENREQMHWREAVKICLGMEEAPLSAWDRGFLESILERRNPLTEKQKIQLLRILEACRPQDHRAA
jgi:hypothetical protein